jgi:hypothetical protein
MIDTTLRDEEYETSLVQIDTMLAQNPDDRRLHDTRLAVLAQLN